MKISEFYLATKTTDNDSCTVQQLLPACKNHHQPVPSTLERDGPCPSLTVWQLLRTWDWWRVCRHWDNYAWSERKETNSAKVGKTCPPAVCDKNWSQIELWIINPLSWRSWLFDQCSGVLWSPWSTLSFHYCQNQKVQTGLDCSFSVTKHRPTVPKPNIWNNNLLR